jgi:hypothetical protein
MMANMPFAQMKRIKMKTKFLLMMTVAGMLAATPAFAWQFNYATYCLRKGYALQPVPPSLVASQHKPAQGNSEVQVAVMVQAPAQPTARPQGADEWFGADARSHATHSR